MSCGKGCALLLDDPGAVDIVASATLIAAATEDGAGDFSEDSIFRVESQIRERRVPSPNLGTEVKGCHLSLLRELLSKAGL